MFSKSSFIGLSRAFFNLIKTANTDYESIFAEDCLHHNGVTDGIKKLTVLKTDGTKK